MNIKPFKNRITQEDKETINQLKRTWIDMNDNNPNTFNTPNGYWFVSINPNTFVLDPLELERDLTHYINCYYRWMYGSKWVKIKNKIQVYYKGVLEKQHGNYHIHLITYNYNIVDFTIFCGFIKDMFKSKYPKTSAKFERVYDIDGCIEYINPQNKKKHRTDESIIIFN